MELTKLKNDIIELSLVTIVELKNDYYEFHFFPINNVLWNPGDYSTFRLDPECENGMEFIINSTMIEGRINFTAKIGNDSGEFKKKLLSLQKGQKIYMDYPKGNFNLNNVQSPNLLLAYGNIGSQPYRAIFNHIQENRLIIEKMSLFYFDKEKLYLNLKHFQKVSEEFSNLNSYSIDSERDFFEAASNFALQYNNDAYYYICAPGEIADELTQLIKEQRVEEKNIHVLKY